MVCQSFLVILWFVCIVATMVTQIFSCFKRDAVCGVLCVWAGVGRWGGGGVICVVWGEGGEEGCV